MRTPELTPPWEDQFGDQETIDAARALMIPAGDYLTLVAPGNSAAGSTFVFGGNALGHHECQPGQYNGNKSPLYSWR
jgi:hypothetical protein